MVGAQAILPEVEREYGKPAGIRHIFLSRKRTSKHGRHAKDLEEVRGNVQSVYGIRMVSRAQVHAHCAKVISGHRLEGLTLPPGHELGDRNRGSCAIGKLALDAHDSL